MVGRVRIIRPQARAVERKESVDHEPASGNTGSNHTHSLPFPRAGVSVRPSLQTTVAALAAEKVDVLQNLPFSRWRKIEMISPVQTAASAADTVMTNTYEHWPAAPLERENATKVRFTRGQHQLDAHEDDDCVPVNENAYHFR